MELNTFGPLFTRLNQRKSQPVCFKCNSTGVSPFKGNLGEYITRRIWRSKNGTTSDPRRAMKEKVSVR